MRALTVVPGVAASATLEERSEPAPDAGEVLVEAVALGVCGTDREILDGRYGEAPPGRTRLVLGHESLGRVLEAPQACGLAAGDRVVPFVRRPDPVPCPSCARGEWDMCQNGRYTEHGIRGLDGFAAERYRVPAHALVRVDGALGALGVLVEPTSVVVKAWDHVDRIGARAEWRPERVLVTGAGPIGLLAALLARERGLEVHVLDRVASGTKPALVEALGATYHHGELEEVGPVDVLLECTGAAPLVMRAMRAPRANGIVCLTGVSSGGRKIPVDAGSLDRDLVLENNVVFGSVNANRAHYESAAASLARADAAWLDRLITRSVPLERWPEAFERRPDDVKVVLTLDGRPPS